jgi:hypothetical protein
VTLLDALDDPALLGATFGGDTWKPWRMFLAAVDGRPLIGDALELYRRCTGRQNPPQAPAREVYGVVGRRGGMWVPETLA